jgi:hypothetical protein
VGAVIIENRTIISVEDAVLHYPQHTVEDQFRVLDAALACGAVSGYTIASDAYVGFLNAAGKNVLYSAVTYFAVAPRAGYVPADSIEVMDQQLEKGAYRVPLSGWETRAVHSGATPAAYGDVCDKHFVTRSLTGVCDLCE